MDSRSLARTGAKGPRHRQAGELRDARAGARLHEAPIIPCRTAADRSRIALLTTERLSLRIDAELKRSLEREARREERSASYLAVKAIEAMLRGRAEKRAAVRAAIAEADQGVFVSQAAMDTWISSWDTVSELPPPEPDTFPTPK